MLVSQLESLLAQLASIVLHTISLNQLLFFLATGVALDGTGQGPGVHFISTGSPANNTVQNREV